MIQQQPTRLLTIEQIRHVERMAIEQLQISGEEMMQRAGRAAVEIMSDFFPSKPVSVIVFCGGGHNGGDGYVLAQLLHELDIAVTLIALKPINQLPPVAKKAAKACQKAGLSIEPLTEDSNVDDLELTEYDLIIDAILGIGLAQEVTGIAKHAIELVNQAGVETSVLSLDVASGVDADTGRVWGDAVKADLVVTFIAGKPGLFTGDAVNYCQQVVCADLDLDELVTEQPNQIEGLDYTVFSEIFLLPRRAGVHKGQLGHALIIGGDLGMPGAAILAGEACLRSGVGLVTIATQPQHVSAVVARAPELMVYGVTQASDLQPLIDKADVIAIGPGLADSAWSQAMFDAVIQMDKPLVIDAGALTLLAKAPQMNNRWILTPHPGEAARLLATTVTEIQNDRRAAIKQLEQQYGGIVVLKGAGTLIEIPETVTQICMACLPSLATAGSGDVLTGAITSFVAQRFPTEVAAVLGVLVHAEAGRLAGRDGERGTRATDLLTGLRQAANPLQLTRAKQKEDVLKYLLTERLSQELENFEMGLDELDLSTEENEEESYH
ncbi:MAG: NAD(P)H-hydrate dehydratase [Legionellales bacterium]|nr:NAD(P)H-hydrate dehydratase [Legionellales bacterium]